MNPRLLGLALLLVPFVARAEEPDIAKLRRAIEAARRASPVAGLGVAIVKDGRVVLAEGFGLADVATHRKATADTVYDIGSCTKAFTALLATQAQVEGKLSLKDRPTKYLPGFALKDPDANARITLEDMLSHRSGLPRTDLAMFAGDFSRDELMRLAAASEPTAPLGKRWQYQNLMVAFAGAAVEKATGEPYDALLRERFFTPLRMTRSAATYAATKAQPELATGYSPTGQPLRLRKIDNVAPAGSISSSANDMARYVTMLLADGEFEGRRIFAKEAVEETRKPRIEMAPGTGQFYGLGWMMSTEGGVKRIFHGGNIDGFTADVALVPAQGLGIVVLANGDSASLPQEVATLVLDALAPKSAAPKVEAFTEAAADELGAYHLVAPPVDVSFTREGKTTFLNQNGAKLPLTLVGPKRYTLQHALFLTFGQTGADGKRTVKLEQGGMTFTLVPAEPFRAPISAAAVLASEVTAQGGPDVVRRHVRWVAHFHVHLPNDAVEMFGIRYRRDAHASADYILLYGLDRRFADLLEASDGATEIVRTSFGLPSVKIDPDAAVANDLLADLDPIRSYRSLTVLREDKVGGAEVYVLQKVAPGGATTLDFVAKADGRLLARVSGKGASVTREEFSDFRTVDGLTLPFRTVATEVSGSRHIEEIDSLRFDEAVPEWPFRL